MLGRRTPCCGTLFQPGRVYGQMRIVYVQAHIVYWLRPARTLFGMQQMSMPRHIWQLAFSGRVLFCIDCTCPIW